MPRRTVRIAYLVGFLLLAAAIGIPLWLNYRAPTAVKVDGPSVESLDVVATGRVDSEGMVRALDGPTPGRVVKVHVAEGAAVKKDQAIVSIDDRAYAEMVRDATLSRDAAVIELEVARAKARTQIAEMDALQLRIDAAKADADAADVKLKQMRGQLNVSAAVPVTQSDIDQLETRIQGYRLNIEAEQVRLNAMRKLDSALESQAAKLRVDASDDAIAKAKRYQRDCTIVAPSDGTIIRLQCGEGAMLTPNPMDPAIVFAPVGALVVRVEVEQADVGRITMNMPASVSDDSLRNPPPVKGTVTAISRWIAPKRSILLDPGNFNDVRTTEVVITLEPTTRPLWIGQRMVVRFGK